MTVTPRGEQLQLPIIHETPLQTSCTDEYHRVAPDCRQLVDRCQTVLALAQASDAVKRAARHVTASNDDDGAAAAIERYVLEPRGVLRGAGYAAYCNDGMTEVKGARY